MFIGIMFNIYKYLQIFANMTSIMYYNNYIENDNVVPMDIDTDDDDEETQRFKKIEHMRKLHKHFLKMVFSEKDKRQYIIFKDMDYYGTYKNIKDVMELLKSNKNMYVRYPNGIFIYPQMNLRYKPIIKLI